MELHMDSHHLERRWPNWTVAAISGFAAGAILMVLELLWSAVASDTGPWGASHAIAAMVMGRDILVSNDFNLMVVAIALINHYILGMVFGMILCAFIAPFHMDSSLAAAAVAGAIFGLLLYFFNFYGMSYIFPWFAEMRGWAALIAHLIFGIATAAIYWRLEPREIKK